MSELYNIEYNRFIRTTDKDHEAAVKKIIEKLQAKGDIYKSKYSGLYCVPCETYVMANQDLEKNESGCYVCPACKRPLKEISEDSYFFRLSSYQDQLLRFYEANPEFIVPKERMSEVVSFVKSGLRDLSISRTTISWGIPFPNDPTHTVYVWIDALPNYLSSIGFGDQSAEAQSHFKKWWPATVQLMGKDIVRFHAVYWPAILMALELPLPEHLLVHGYILCDKQKMSKSLGNVVDPQQLVHWYGVDPVRYYLVKQMAITQDGNFDIKDLEARITGDLANNLGNLLNRTVTLALSNGFEKVTMPETFESSTASLREKCAEMFRLTQEEMNRYHFHIALAEIGKFINAVNAFFHEQQPWKLAKENKELFEEVIGAVCNSLYAIGIVLWPVMPQKMEELLTSLGHTLERGKNYEQGLRENNWHTKTFVLKKTETPLFVRPETHVQEEEPVAQKNDKKIEKAPEIPVITIDEFTKVHLVAGTILSCQPVSGSEKLLYLTVDLGSVYGVRNILSGVALHFKPENLIGKQGIYVANLAPRMMMGLESQGMMLFAENDKKQLTLVTVAGPVPNGTRIK
jgi:methionyl-tRNA synthetase